VGVAFTLIGLVLSAYSMKTHHLSGLFVGRLITGLFAGSTSVCLSCITDLCDNEKLKVKYFGYLSMVAGLAFVVGAFVGGKLSDRTINASFSSNSPLWLAAGLTAINFLFVVFGFRETSRVHPDRKFDFFASFHNIGMALRTEKIKRIYALYFLFIFAWTILFQFIPVLAVERFAFTNSDLGDMAFFMGVCWAIGSGYLNKLLIQYFSTHAVLEVCLLGFTVLCSLVVFPHKVPSVLALLGVCVMFGGIAWPICTGLISNTAPPHMQGKILGVSQSIQSFGMTMAALVGGAAFQFSLGLPFFLAGATSLCAVVIYYLTLKRQ
jgi:DHA1 family tetracycline resistance protein-like MFS transporter